MAILNINRDRETTNRIRNNDRSVLGELFLKHEKMVKSYIFKNGGNLSDAEDILQEATIVLWQKACSDDFELTAQLSTYLMSIAKNKWLAETRKRKHRAAQEIPANVADGSLSALDDIILTERAASVKQALNSLNEVCRELLLLFYFEERNFRDIARIMGFNGPDVAKSKKYQCKKALEIALKKSIAEPEGKQL